MIQDIFPHRFDNHFQPDEVMNDQVGAIEASRAYLEHIREAEQ